MRGATASLPPPSLRKYHAPIPVKASKAADVQKIVERYVPAEHQGFYCVVQSADNVSSETDDNDE